MAKPIPLHSLYSLFTFIAFYFLIFVSSLQNIRCLNIPTPFKTYLNGLNEDGIYEFLASGEIDGYLSYGEYIKLLEKIGEEFKDILKVETIGTTVNKREIKAVIINKAFPGSKGMLYTGMHHAREPLSFTMTLLVLLRLLRDYSKNSKTLMTLIATRNIYFIPIINVDGYAANNECYLDTGNLNLCMVRKNRNFSKNEDDSCLSFDGSKLKQNVGVDINRNYGYKFGFDLKGSSSNPCEEDYRGPSAFSELETQAIRKFFDDHTDIKAAINYHAWGNLLIMPFNFSNQNIGQANWDYLKSNFPDEEIVYRDIIKNGKFPTKFLYGNGVTTIGYSANGEASDWMLGEKRVVAFSPELGVSDLEGPQQKQADDFYPKIKTVGTKVLKENFPGALYVLEISGYYLELSLAESYYLDCGSIHSKFTDYFESHDDSSCKSGDFGYKLKLELKNKGFGIFPGGSLLQLDSEKNYFKAFTLKVDKKVIANEKNTESHCLPILRNVKFNIEEHIKQQSSVYIYLDFFISKESFPTGNFTLSFSSLNKDQKEDNVLGLNFDKPSLIVKQVEFYKVKSEEKLKKNDPSNNQNYVLYIVICVFIAILLFAGWKYIVNKFKSAELKEQNNEEKGTVEIPNYEFTENNTSVSYSNELSL